MAIGKVITARHSRLRKLARRLLRHLKLYGLDDNGLELRQSMSIALARFSDLGLHPEADSDEVDRIRSIRVGFIGVLDQLEAMLADYNSKGALC